MPTSTACLTPAKATEQLFSISCKGRKIVCELQDLGRGGVEVQFLSDCAPFYGNRFRTYELAIEWAEAERRSWGWMRDDEPAP